MAADVADAARRARSGERRGGKVTEHDLRLVLRLAKRAGALEVRVGGMTIMFARDAGKRSAQAAPTRRSPAAVPPRAPQSARPARTARPEEPEAEAPSTSPNSRHRRSANRLLVFQARKRREEARGLSLSRILCRAAMQRLRASWIAASCSNTAPLAAVDPELDVAEPRQPSDTLAVAVHTAALKRRLPPCVLSTYGQCIIQEGKANSQPRLDSNPRLGSPPGADTDGEDDDPAHAPPHFFPISQRLPSRAGAPRLAPIPALAAAIDPRSHRQAMKAPEAAEWQAAKLAELQNHTANGSFREMNRGNARRLADAHGANFNVTGCLWVYKTKRDGRRKARLCLNGASQQEGVDYDQTSSSTLRHSSVRVLIAIQARLGHKSRRHDLVAAFLQGSLLADKIVFMKYPPGHTEVGADGKDKVYLVQKPIYGLKQAGRRFQRDFFTWLKLPIDQGGAGFTRSEKEPCIFTRCVGNDTVYLGVYCDDIIAIFGDDDVGSVYDVFRTALHTRWKAEDEGELIDILNICVAHEGSSIKLSQPTYIDTMVERYLPVDKLRADIRYRRHLTLYTSKTTSRRHLPPRQQPTRHRTLLYSPNTSR